MIAQLREQDLNFCLETSHCIQESTVWFLFSFTVLSDHTQSSDGTSTPFCWHCSTRSSMALEAHSTTADPPAWRRGSKINRRRSKKWSHTPITRSLGRSYVWNVLELQFLCLGTLHLLWSMASQWITRIGRPDCWSTSEPLAWCGQHIVERLASAAAHPERPKVLNMK